MESLGIFTYRIESERLSHGQSIFVLIISVKVDEMTIFFVFLYRKYRNVDMIMQKKYIILFVWTCLFVLFFSCSNKNAYDKLLTRADSIMDIADDSACVAINLLDNAKPLLTDFSKSQKMRYYLLYHKAMNKAYIPFKSDSIMLEVTYYYNKYGNANEKMLAYYILGCVYRDMHEAPMALEYYNKAAEQADTSSNNCDYKTLCRIYNQMGVLFDLQHLPYQELNSSQKATKYALLAKDTLNAIRYYQSRIGAYGCLNNEDSVAYINAQSANLFRQHGYLVDSKIAFGGNFEYYLKKNMTSEAERSYQAYLSSNYIGNSNYEDAYAYLLYRKGLYNLFKGKNDSSYIFFKQSLEQSKSYSNKAAAMKGLSRYYSIINNPMLAAKYALLSSAYNDSDLISTRNSQLQQLQAMYDYNRNKELAREAKSKIKQWIDIIYVIIGVSIFLLLVSFSIYKKKLKKRNQRIAMIQQLYHESKQQLNAVQQELLKLQSLNENTIANLIEEKEVAIQKLKAEIQKYEVANIGHNLLVLDKQLQQSLIYKKLIYLENHPQENMNQRDWNNLEETVENLVYGFANLKQKLNTKEYHICLLIKLHFTPSSISSFVGTSLSDISNSRQRMLSKVCGKFGKAKEFDEYIRSIL